MTDDPVLDLLIEAKQTDPETLEVSWSDPGSSNQERNVGSVGLRPRPFGSVDWLVYDPGLVDVPFLVVPSGVGYNSEPGRKVVGLLSWHHEEELDVVLVTADGRIARDRRRRRPEPATSHELDLVAALADRVETGTFLGDLSEAGLVVRVVVDRLSAPLGALILEDGRFRWEER